MKRILLFLLLVGMMAAGCISLGKKQCDSTACMKTALLNNCEEAILEKEVLGIKIKSEITNEGSRCKVAETAAQRTKVCYYEMPVPSNLAGNCSYT